MASGIVGSLRLPAARAAFLRLPAAGRHSSCVLRMGVWRTAVGLAMDSLRRTPARPPRIPRWPRIRPGSRFGGATPTRACRRCSAASASGLTTRSPGMPAQHAGEHRQHPRLQRACPRRCPHRASEVARPARIDHRHRQARSLQRAGRPERVATGGLQHRQRRLQAAQPMSWPPVPWTSTCRERAEDRCVQDVERSAARAG
jgi:hypothetical protein